jgi:glycosyltransferase involved in cell wall biosynthesis
LEWRRKKWGKLAATVLKFSSRVAPILSNEVITDSLSVQKYYKEAYNAETTYIPYGRRQQEPQSFDILEELGVEPRGFFLYVSRFDPENNPLLVRKAYELVSSEKKLLMVGSAPYADDYIKQVKDTTDSRIVFTGAIYGDGYLQLQHSAYAYVQATEIGGVHPALVEAAGAGNCVIANDVPEHREVLLDAGIYYPGTVEGLAAKLQWAQDNPEPVAHHRSLSRKVAERFSWDSITTEYEVCFAGMLGVDNDALLAETMRNNEPASVSERVA